MGGTILKLPVLLNSGPVTAELILTDGPDV